MSNIIDYNITNKPEYYSKHVPYYKRSDYVAHLKIEI